MWTTPRYTDNLFLCGSSLGETTDDKWAGGGYRDSINPLWLGHNGIFYHGERERERERSAPYSTKGRNYSTLSWLEK
jgi:hypothetical protein